MIGAVVALLLAATPAETSVAGQYDGSGQEIFAMLELKPDGSFQYGLSYGALGEEAEGRWRMSGDRVVLDQLPVVPPKIALVATTRSSEPTIRIDLDIPQGMSRQYFEALIERSDGPDHRQLGEDGLELPVDRSAQPIRLRLTLPILGVVSDPVELAGGGMLHFRFDPNDAGKADLRQSPLLIEGDTLILVRHERRIRFKRAE